MREGDEGVGVHRERDGEGKDGEGADGRRCSERKKGKGRRGREGQKIARLGSILSQGTVCVFSSVQFNFIVPKGKLVLHSGTHK